MFEKIRPADSQNIPGLLAQLREKHPHVRWCNTHNAVEYLTDANDTWPHGEKAVRADTESKPGAAYQRVKGKHDGKFTIVDNGILNDPQMSLEARGLLATMLQFPAGWQFHNKDLLKRMKCSLYKLKEVLRELDELGYLRRTRLQEKTGKIVWLREVADTPKWRQAK